jgi:putative DNA primase/helicase
MTPLDAAVEYARRGWPVFPVALIKRGGRVDKQPLVKWGSEASTNPAQIRLWWYRWPRVLIGIPTGKRSGIVVLDIDVKDGRNGFDRLAELGKSILPDTPMAHTHSGGLHIYFAVLALEIRNSAGEHGLGVGLDVRGEGGFIVVPSPDSGYCWDPHYNLDTVPLMPAPAWLGHRQQKSSLAPRANGYLDPPTMLATACATIRAADPGQRHEVLNREAFIIGTLVAAGAISESTAHHELATATAAMVWRSDGDRRKAADDLADAFSAGIAKSRRRGNRR